jgi:hypothetical protein
MRTEIKDRIINAVLIVVFLLAIAGSGYFIVRVMMHWNLKGLG